MDNTLFKLADELQALREHKEALEADLAQANKDIYFADRKLSGRMADSETQNFTRAGVCFYLTDKSRYNAIPGQQEALLSAFKAQGFGELIKEQINANTLSSFVREQARENDDRIPSWLEGLVSKYENIVVGVRKAAR